MSREWKLGDVAGGRISGYEGRFIYRGDGGGWDEVDGDDGGWRGDCIHDLRPLVVIDPHDTAAADRLQDLYIAAEAKGLSGLSMLAAINGFATPPPPKPDEPTGLGAVVEAICCHPEPSTLIHDPLSTRFEGRPLEANRNWKSVCGHHSWDALTAVRVLSEGVTP